MAYRRDLPDEVRVETGGFGEVVLMAVVWHVSCFDLLVVAEMLGIVRLEVVLDVLVLAEVVESAWMLVFDGVSLETVGDVPLVGFRRSGRGGQRRTGAVFRWEIVIEDVLFGEVESLVGCDADEHVDLCQRARANQLLEIIGENVVVDNGKSANGRESEGACSLGVLTGSQERFPGLNGTGSESCPWRCSSAG